MLIIATKPVELMSLVANPFTGKVEMSLGKEAIAMYGPAYVPILRAQLENALKIVEAYENTAFQK